MENLRLIYWRDIRSNVHQLDPILADIIDDIDPKDNLPLYEVTYPYGATILDFDSGFHVPLTQNETVSINDYRIPSKIKDDLTYQGLPFGIIIENSVEIYSDLNNKIFSVTLFEAGKSGIELGIWEYFGWKTPYSVSAGARSVYMIPSIGTVVSHNKLQKKFSNLKSPPPSSPVEHWKIFREIASSKEFKNKWYCKVIFFGKNWYNKIKNEDDPRFLKLKSYILVKCWNHTDLGKKKLIVDFMWDRLNNFINYKRVFKPSPYVIDIVKHVFLITLGGTAGSAPFTGDNVYGPLSEIQEVYLEVYNLKYNPIILCPQLFDIKTPNSVYYSIQNPMFLSSTPGLKTVVSNIEHMREVLYFINFMKEANFGNLMINEISLENHLKNVKIDFFHNELYTKQNHLCNNLIKPVNLIYKEDERFLINNFKNSQITFPMKGNFIFGCIRISQ